MNLISERGLLADREQGSALQPRTLLFTLQQQQLQRTAHRDRAGTHGESCSARSEPSSDLTSVHCRPAASEGVTLSVTFSRFNVICSTRHSATSRVIITRTSSGAMLPSSGQDTPVVLRSQKNVDALQVFKRI